jgi:hypothetical protein
VSNPDIQYFAVSGTWVKPAGAVRVDIVLQGGGAGNAVPYPETAVSPSGGGTGGSWPVIPAGVYPGECGGNSSAYIGRRINPNGYQCSSGEPGDIRVSSFDAADLPDTVEVEVGKGGRPGGRDGYALIVTHLAEAAS